MPHIRPASVLIESIRPRNVLSFGPDTRELTLGQLNVCIGANGAGKSNLLDIVGLLRAAPSDLRVPIRHGRSVADWIWQGETVAQSVQLSLAVNPSGHESLRYVLEFEESGQRLAIVEERLALTSDLGNPLLRSDGGVAVVRAVLSEEQAFKAAFDHTQSGKPGLPEFDSKMALQSDMAALARAKDPNLYPQVTALGDALGQISLYRQWTFGQGSVVRSPQRTDLPNDQLLEDNSNLGLVLNRLARNHESKQRMLDALQAIYEGVTDFHVNVEYGTVQVFLQERGGKLAMPATRLSDGTMRYLCLLAILCDPDPPPLICIDEPELGLHPDVIHSLANLLREASERTQLIVTTHSDGLVDAMTDTPECVLVFDKVDGCTTVERLDQESLAHWLEQYRLGELWSSGRIGGNRW